MADFVFKFRLRAQFELQLLGNNFVFKSFGISASGGVRNRDPLSRVNAQQHAASSASADASAAGVPGGGSAARTRTASDPE